MGVSSNLAITLLGWFYFQLPITIIVRKLYSQTNINTNNIPDKFKSSLFNKYTCKQR